MSNGQASPRQVLVVDDQRSFAQSIEVVLDVQGDLRCVGAATSGTEAIEMARRFEPDVVLLDVDLPDIDGIEVTRQLLNEFRHLHVVILTGIPDATLLARAASAGAKAFLLKSSSVQEIVDVIRSASDEDQLDVDADALRQILDEGASASMEQITQRELEVLGLLAQGRQPKEIAQRLGITVNTCRGHVKNLLQKLGAHSALEAVVIAHRDGLISLESPSP